MHARLFEIFTEGQFVAELAEFNGLFKYLSSEDNLIYKSPLALRLRECIFSEILARYTPRNLITPGHLPPSLSPVPLCDI